MPMHSNIFPIFSSMRFGVDEFIQINNKKVEALSLLPLKFFSIPIIITTLDPSVHVTVWI